MNEKGRMLVPIRKLLSVCIYANLEACQIIRQYYYHESLKDKSSSNSSNNSNNSIRYKEEGDSRSVVTKADIDAQCKIMSILRKQEPWGPHIHIIGEEDDDEVSTSSTPTTTTNHNNEDEDEAISNILQQIFPQTTHNVEEENDESVPMDELCIFIDPLDGTREFVENRIQNVGCLIGITRNGKAIAGTIGVPFPSNHKDDGTSSFIRYALLNHEKHHNPIISGIWPHDDMTQQGNLKDISNDDDTTDGGTIIYTGDSKNKVLASVVQHAKQIILESNKEAEEELQHIIVGGTAAKLTLIATSTTASMAILHVGTSVWDTVATEALVRSNGGHVTDFLGRPLETHSHPSKIKNLYGVIASSSKARSYHDQLCQTIQQQQTDPTLLHRILNPE